MKRVLAVVLCLGMLGCIHKATSVTPWERVTTENAILAQLINTAEQGTVAVQTSGLITAKQAEPILAFESQAAQIQLQINSVLAVAPNTAGIAQIQSLVGQIGIASQALVNSGAVGIKNPKSQQTIGADIQAIVGSANLILASYQAAVGGN
jgi:hypothetical protein